MNAPRVATSRGRKPRRRNGQSLVEFALILPVFLLILAGLLDYGMMLFSRMNLINATREGARWAVVQADTSKIDSDGTVPGLQQSGGPIGVNLQGLAWGNLTVTLTCVDSAGGSCDFTTGGNKANRGDSIIVQTRYAYASFFAKILGHANVDLGTQVRMVLEVPTP